MPRFKVFRTKRYEAYVDAAFANQALALALDVPGREWTLVEDKVLGEVGGLDNHVREIGPDKVLFGDDEDKN